VSRADQTDALELRDRCLELFKVASRTASNPKSG